MSGNTQVWLSDWAGTTEGDPTPAYVVVSRNDTSGDLGIAWSVSGGAAPDCAYPNGFNIPDGQNSVRVDIATLDDFFAEDTQYLAIQLSEAEGYLLSGGPSSAELPVYDNDGTIHVSVTAQGDVYENSAEPAVFIIARDTQIDQAVTVSFTLSGTATSGDDFDPFPNSVTIEAWEWCTTVSVVLRDNSQPEVPETLTLTLAGGDYVPVAGSDSATITIYDDDLPTVSVVNNEATVTEGSGSACTFTVYRSGAVDNELTVGYSVGGDVTLGADYGQSEGWATFAPGASSCVVSIGVWDDSIYEPDETLCLSLSPDDLYYLDGTYNTAWVTIVDDQPPPPVVSVSAAPATISESDRIMAGFVLTFSRPLGYSGYISYSVSGTATNGTDYYSVSGGGYFSGWESQTTVYFDFTPYVFDDSTYEGDETLTLTVEPPSGGEYQVDPTANTATITILDNEPPPPTVTIGDVAVEEGDTAYFVVSLSQALDHDVTIYYTTVDETANAADYTPVSGSVTIAAGSTDAVIAVETIYNRADAVAETFRLDYCTQDQSVVCAAPATGTITVAGPWSRGEWKLVGDVYQGVAYAASRYNTLSELAESITGDWMDASLLAPVEGGIVIGTVVDISPLLQKFEDRLRTNIVAAAGAPKAATFPGENDEFSIGDGMKEAAVNAVFQTPGATLPVLDCRGMARVVMAYGLIETLYSWYDTPADRQSKHYFDRLGLDPKILFDSYTSQRRGPLEEMKAGDLIGFRNRTGYENLHRRGAYGALNTIKTGDDAFYCWNDGTRTEAGSCQLLCDKYNEGIEQKINLDQVPGYVGYAFFVNVPRICAKVFDLRTSQTTAT